VLFKKKYSLCFSYRHTPRSNEAERAQRSLLYISRTQKFPSRVALHKGTYNRFEKLYICLTIKGCLISYCCTFDLSLQKTIIIFEKSNLSIHVYFPTIKVPSHWNVQHITFSFVWYFVPQFKRKSENCKEVVDTLLKKFDQLPYAWKAFEDN